MKTFFKQPVLHFLLVVAALLIFSLAIGVSVDIAIKQFIDAQQTIEQSASLTPTPTLPPEVKGLSTESATTSAIVSEVIDGDTIRLSTGEKVRYIGIDTPETVDPNKDKQCYGSEASTQNELLVFGKEVILEKDVSEIDRYGRLLRYVWLDGEMVNEKLVREGYAIEKAYKPDTKYQDKFTVAQQDAQINKKGLWRECITQ